MAQHMAQECQVKINFSKRKLKHNFKLDCMFSTEIALAVMGHHNDDVIS